MLSSSRAFVRVLSTTPTSSASVLSSSVRTFHSSPMALKDPRDNAKKKKVADAREKNEKDKKKPAATPTEEAPAAGGKKK